MAARKLATEVDKCFKKVNEGVAEFEKIHEKILSCANPSQKEKLEDALKKEIKKLQRSRDQIKAWAASNDIKDKQPLIDHRRLIETQMEKFKAVEKEMKTKAYSKEGLSAASKLDPQEQEKVNCCQFLSGMVDDLERQIETLEAEVKSLQITMKKSKKDTSKAERIATLESTLERHKWHENKLELLLRLLENGSVEPDQVKTVEEDIRYYVERNQDADFMEDDSLYDDFNLAEEEGVFGLINDNDKVSSLDSHSSPGDAIDDRTKSGSSKAAVPAAHTSGRRATSSQVKSPLPAFATLSQTTPSAHTTNPTKPAPIPPPGANLKYASAAAAAAANDKHNVGISPLPVPPGLAKQSSGSVASPRPSTATAAAMPAATATTSHTAAKSPAPSHTSAVPASVSGNTGSVPPTPAMQKAERVGTQKPSSTAAHSTPTTTTPVTTTSSATAPASVPSTSTSTAAESHKKSHHALDSQPGTPALTTGESNSEPDEEAIFHLPASLQDLLDSYDTNPGSVDARPPDDQMLAASLAMCPETSELERTPVYRPENPYPFTPSHYPQEPLPVFDNPRIYSQADTDTLFYLFYYRQGTYQQYLAAKALKSQSWRFHKQYQTWFQRHDEPQAITDEYEQGTYRFFDYESTWMNRRKADFRFHYQFLEDEP